MDSEVQVPEQSSEHGQQVSGREPAVPNVTMYYLGCCVDGSGNLG